MKDANKALKAQYKKVNLDKIEVSVHLDGVIRFAELINRQYKMKWRICLNRRMRCKKLWVDHMPLGMTLMKMIWKLVR